MAALEERTSYIPECFADRDAAAAGCSDSPPAVPVFCVFLRLVPLSVPAVVKAGCRFIFAAGFDFSCAVRAVVFRDFCAGSGKVRCFLFSERDVPSARGDFAVAGGSIIFWYQIRHSSKVKRIARTENHQKNPVKPAKKLYTPWRAAA